MASPTESSVDSASWLKISRMAVGMMSHVTIPRMRSVPRRSSDRTSENRRASDASWLAYDSAPMRSARYQPCPAVTKLPDNTSSPGAFTSGTDSPESSDSSTSSASAASTLPSATIWVPWPNSTTSPSTTSSRVISWRSPLRATVTAGAVSSDSWSRVRLARHSW